MSSASHRSRDLQRAITRYCALHPSAADTVAGVRMWWIGDPACPLDEVGAALDALVAAQALDVRLLPDGTAIYFCRAAG